MTTPDNSEFTLPEPPPDKALLETLDAHEAGFQLGWASALAWAGFSTAPSACQCYTPQECGRLGHSIPPGAPS